MNSAQPIRTPEELEHFKEYYQLVKPRPRNYLLIVLGLNTALRISDILELHWENVYDFIQGHYRDHISITEQKTGKKSCIFLNQSILDALEQYRRYLIFQKKKEIQPQDFIFCHSNKNLPISRVQAFRIIKTAADNCQLSGSISCHSLRKTFGYYAWQQGASPALLMNVYNHSSYEVTKRYLGIEQDDRDNLFRSIRL